jgi:hypothetical protein
MTDQQRVAPTIIAAPAGAFTALAWVRLDDLAGHAVEMPIIGFDCSDSCSSPKPITVLCMQFQAIRYADGRVLDLVDACEFSNRGEWQSHAKARANKWAEDVEAAK